MKRRGRRRKAEKVQNESFKIPMEQFIARAIFDSKIQSWQGKEIEAFFKDMKLEDKEEFTVYEETLKKY